MKVSFAAVSAIILAAFMPAVQADFDIYQVRALGPRWIVRWQWHVGNGQMTCDMLNDGGLWPQELDVSGSKRGVRCSGNGCRAGEPIVEIDVLEMHFKNHPLRH
ncbi:hypothetical protein CcaCcLH18_09331 [Colletotrichum camelliae]|nr:hypothetical protein CcaCcLH18_09331 [Colletotrichum camelliae]